MKHYNTVLTIAGSDCSGGAGIQADIKTISALGCYATSVITTLTAQNTTGVKQIHELPSSFVQEQLDSVFEDIHCNVVKIGMLHNESIINTVSQALQKWKPNFIVLDPVMIAKNGCQLIQSSAIQQMENVLFPLVTLITPNTHEAEHLANTTIKNVQDMKNSAKAISHQYQINTLIKGGHLAEKTNCTDILYLHQDESFYVYSSRRIETKNTHGTGCTYSAAIAAYSAQGFTLPEAIKAAKSYISLAIESGSHYQIGHGHGPVNHFFRLLSN